MPSGAPSDKSKDVSEHLWGFKEIFYSKNVNSVIISPSRNPNPHDSYPS